MKKSLFLVLSLVSINLFAADCSYQQNGSLDLSNALTGTLEELGCVEDPESKRAENHLRIDLLTYNDLEKQLVIARATVVNLRNGHVVQKVVKQSIIRGFAVAWKTYTEADYDRAQGKALAKLQSELAAELGTGWILE